jgi:Flp pilus assembly pilin Flp
MRTPPEFSDRFLSKEACYSWLTTWILFIDVKMSTRYDIFISILFILIMSKRICLMESLVYQKNREKGQGLVEYAFLFVLVALVILVAMEFLAPIIGNTFINIVNPLNREDGTQTVTATQTPMPTHTSMPSQTPTSTPTPTWTTCAAEDGFCSFTGTTEVRYGANGTWTSGTYTNGVLCANSIFGDPIVGTAKTCQILISTSIPTDTAIPTNTAIPTDMAIPTASPTPMPTWTTCAVENVFCSFSGTAVVRYGAIGFWASGTYTDGVSCANSVFGDPIYGTVKSCQIYR